MTWRTRSKVIALNDGHGYVLVYKDGSEKKHELVYEDHVSPATGVTNRIIYYGIGFTVTAAILIYAGFKKRNGRWKRSD